MRQSVGLSLMCILQMNLLSGFIIGWFLFMRGNGRHARFMADLILGKIFNKEPFTWGRVNLAKTGDVRAMYIEALKKADNYNYEALLKFVRS
jgi:fido (protein-threonine AMPylation protein)